MTNYNDGKWHGWNGGECPVHPETMVKWVNTQGDSHETTARTLSWNDEVSPVVAFRVIKEHKPAREWWCVMSHMFGSEDKAKIFLDELNEEHPGMNFGQVYKVREVLE